MGAPTWPPTPEDAFKATLKEYGDDARAVMHIEDDEEAELQLLAQLLFRAPGRELASGEEIGTPLEAVSRSMEAWLCMISGRPVGIAPSDPSCTDGERIFLPRAMPAPSHAQEDALLYRVMALIQLGLLQFGFLRQRKFLVEVHRDWVLRSCYHLLATRYIIRRWPEIWPGMRHDFEAVRFLSKAAVLRVNLLVVPSKGMPDAFLALYDGLIDHLDAPKKIPAEVATALEAVDSIQMQAGAPLVVMGQAQRLRQYFRTQRLGPPPLPWFCGIIRPEWLLHDLSAEMAQSDAWKEGPKPLELLRRAVDKKGGLRMNDRIRKLMGAENSSAPPGDWEALTKQGVARPETDENGRRYDEWDGERGVIRVGVTKVKEVLPQGGSLTLIPGWRKPTATRLLK